MILSMTGLGMACAEAGVFRGSVVVRSLNHRFLDVTLRVSRGIVPLEAAIRERIQSRLRRGRVEAAVRGELGGASTQVSIARPLVKALVAELRGVAQEHNVRDDLSLADLVAIPGLIDFGEEAQPPDAQAREAVVGLVDRALDELDAMRRAEGARLADAVGGHLQAIARGASEIRGSAQESRSQRRTELVERAFELRAALGVDEARLYQEIARLVERADVCEELDRLQGHVSQARETMAAGGACGKVLDFLAQEMMREANTIGSKAGAGSIVREVIGLKSEIERFREQVQNVE